MDFIIIVHWFKNRVNSNKNTSHSLKLFFFGWRHHLKGNHQVLRPEQKAHLFSKIAGLVIHMPHT